MTNLAHNAKYLRQQAEHCRRLAKLLTDPEGVSELLKFAAAFEAEAKRLDAAQIAKGQSAATPAEAPAPAQLSDRQTKEK